MPAESRTELIEFLAAGRFDDILGTAESQEIEFKSEQYHLLAPKGRADLIADVASFANAIGGVIVLGVKTAKDSDSPLEMAIEVAGVDPAHVNAETYLDLIQSKVHPLVKRLEFRWYKSEETPERNIFAIVINVQQDYDKPFIVERIVPEGKDTFLANAVGWPERSGAGTHWYSAARVQQLLSHGLRAVVQPEGPSGDEAFEPEAEYQFEYVESLDGWDEWGFYAVQALPPAAAGRIPDFYGAFAQRVAEWQGLRPSGFNLSFEYQRPEAVGSRLIMPHPTRTAFIVSRNGVVTGAAMASPDYLGWAHTPDREPEELERVLLNQVPLIEFTTEVIRFAYECVGAELGKEGWTLRAVGRRLLSRVPVNLDLRLSTGPFPPLPNPATRDEFRVELRGTSDVFRDAWALLIEVYGEGFGLGEDTLPFVRDHAIDLTLVGS